MQSLTGTTVPHLCGAGSAMASIIGGNFSGAGITPGPALTFVYIAGKHLAGSMSRQRHDRARNDR